MQALHSWQDLTDERLVKLAQEGESVAYNELMLRYRERMLRWSMAIVLDRHLAEDILQEAMLRAYQQLASLRSPDKFLSWMKRIVRNHAYMAVRRGGPYAKELPFTACADWKDIEEKDGNPLDILLRSENERSIQGLLRQLNEKERGMLEEHIIHQRTPQEIALRYATSSSNVYATISRSRRKLQVLQYQRKLTLYLNDRRSQKGMTAAARVQLGIQSIYFGEIWDTFALSVLHAIQYKGRSSYSMTDIMGLTGFAFRLQMKKSRIDWECVKAIHWPTVYTKALGRLGFEAAIRGDGQKIYSASDKLMEAYSFVQQSLERGHPVIVWGIRKAYFGLIHGFDDLARCFYMTGLFEETVIPYEELGPAGRSELFVLSIGASIEVSRKDAIREAIADIIVHADGQELSRSEAYEYGLEAYNTWIRLIGDRLADPFENAYMVWSTANSRQFACQFLQELSHHAGNWGGQGENIARGAAEAAYAYGEALNSFQRLKRLFPFPHGGKPCGTNVQAEAIELLTSIRHAEGRGIDSLRMILEKF